MNFRVFGLLAAFFFLVSCAHTQPPVQECPACPAQRTCNNGGDIEATLAIKRKTCGDYQELQLTYEKSQAWVPRWTESFTRISKLVKTALAPEEVEDSSQNTGGADDVRYTVEFISGAMHLTLLNNQLFDKGKGGLTPKGKKTIGKLVEVLRKIDQRKITIGCRTTLDNKKSTHAQWLKVRELSATRAIAIISQIENAGIDPRNLSAASWGNFPAEDAMERGTTTIVIHPTPREMPRFADRIQ